MSTPSLPSYSHAETPSYSRHPRGDESTLGMMGRARRQTGIPALADWTKRSGNVTLTLAGLPENTELPVYGRNTNIEGFVAFGSTEGIVGVHIKLEGHVKCKTIAEIGRTKVQVLDTSVTLWRQGDSPCPAVIPFRIPFSTTYTIGEERGSLPPTFEYTFYDVQGGTPGLRATVKYTLRVGVEQNHLSLKDRLSSSLSTSLTYLPRSRPGMPTSPVPTAVFEAVMERRVGGKSREFDPIVWKLILPKPGTYALKQPIPFRVGVTSRSSSLISPFAPSKKDKASIRVYALRQVSIKVKNIDLWRTFNIGEGTLTYIPQSIDQDVWLKNVPASPSQKKTPSVSSGSSGRSLSDREGWASYEWTGVLTIKQDQLTVGGFQVGGMAVKDFIVLSVVPANPRLGSLLETKRVVPIQLTTDSWEDFGPVLPGSPFDNNTGQDSNGFLEGRGDGHHLEGNHNGINSNGANNSDGVFTAQYHQAV